MKKYLAIMLLAFTLVCLLVVSTSAATFTNPVANGADPFVFKDTDGTYYMYVTSGGSYGYRVYTSTNLVEWESRGYCLRRDDVYTDPTILNSAGTAQIYNFWAPEIIKEGNTYYMVYTAQEHIGIATSDSPLGPFKNNATSYLLPSFKNIDGHFFKDTDGKVYLYFVSAGSASYNGYTVYGGNNIWGGQFDLANAKFVTTPKLLVNYDTTVRDNVAEGPEMLKHNGKYYLTYSASGYTDHKYAVHYATSTSPLGTFSKYSGNPIFITDDPNKTDTSGTHLYGTAHHCFTTSPDGKEMIMVYHAHRSGKDPNNTGSTVEERRICIDLAWFDSNGVLHAGRNKDGVPSATAQALPSGATLKNKQSLTGTFAALSSLPTVYVASIDGNDSAAGTKAAPFKTLDAAYAKLKNGGTIILTQTYAMGTYYDAPAVNGPIMIKGAFSAVPVTFKFFSVNSDTYFDNISFWPQTANNISVIECNYSNVTFGEGVSCIAQAPTRKTFPCIVGGKWWSTASGDPYTTHFKYSSNSEVTTDKEYTINVLSGTWSFIHSKSVKDNVRIGTTCPNSVVNVAGDAIIRPAKAAAPTVKVTGTGAKLTIAEIPYATKYMVYKDGKFLAYATSTTYVDKTWEPGETAEYAIAGYAHGACIGDTGAATSYSYVVDHDGNGTVNISDAITVLKNTLNGKGSVTLFDVLMTLKYAVK